MNKEVSIKKINRLVLMSAKKEFIFKVLISMFVRASVMIIPILFGMAVDNISNKNYDTAVLMVIFSMGLITIQRISEEINTYSWHKLYNKLYENYTNYALDYTYNNSIFSLSRISLSEYMNIMNNDINIMAEFYCNLITRIVRIFEFAIIFVYFFMINMYIGIAGIIVSLVAFSILFFSSKKIENVNKIKSANLDKKSSVLYELLLCMKEIKGFNIFGSIKTRIKDNTKVYTNSVLKQRVTEDAFKFSMLLLIDLFRLGLFLYGIYLISKGNMTLGVLIVIYNYYSQLIDNFSEFSAVNINIRQVTVAENRYNKILEFSKNSEKHYNNISSTKGEIVFENVLYGYKSDPILDDVSLKIEPNTINVITGKAGSGKSGVFDLLLKLNVQHEGKILIDNTDINEYSTDEYFEFISLVSKEPNFFNMSIKENLSIVNSDFERTIRTCKKLGIHEYITQLKDGYDTIINSSADNLKPTVKYLLGIARVLSKNSKIMLFDETLSTLDNETKQKVINILKEKRRYHTIVIASRELDILKIADKVFVLNENKLEVTGSHRDLINSNETYEGIIGK
jgi:ABC-type bacteriocin/lantibiotic exporters, contain an N-terminal double-glycine peptidase domain